MNSIMNKPQKKSDVRPTRKTPRFNQAATSGETAVTKKTLKQHFLKQSKKNYVIEDVYEKAQMAKEMQRGATGIIYDPQMASHMNLWYPAHQECPARFTQTLIRCGELGLLNRCSPVDVRRATEAELLTVHSQSHVDLLKSTAGFDPTTSDVDKMEELASRFDAVYIHPNTYDCALLSAGSTIELVNAICTGQVQNGMAIVRPPGHHALHCEFNGYCFFNNVAIAARHALSQLGLARLLIVDWDAHHGQASQRAFYDDPRVVYFSIHRYEHGAFWPNLRESEFDCVGEGAGRGYNFNLPLNKTGQGDAEYLAVFQQLLLPMAAEFQPELIIVSAGYDAALGCPEGEMNVTPACYAHLVSSLMGFASGKVAVVLEGGYCVRSLAEGAALTLRALLGDPCPNLPPLDAPSDSVQESILNCIYSHRPFWKCFQLQPTYPTANYDPESKTQHRPVVRFEPTPSQTQPFPTRDTNPGQSQAFKDEINRQLDKLQAETRLLKTVYNVCFLFDPLMMEHRNLNDSAHPENPIRIQRIYEKHLDYNLLDRLHRLPSRHATREELLLVHDESYLKELEQLCSEDLTDDVKNKHNKLEKHNSVYLHPQSYKGASLAAGSVLQVVDSVLRGESRSGVAVVRPPGHHAESYEACGFCMFNNVSIAAKYAAKNYGVNRILILDWDVHHGNGTQRIFLSDPQVLYISIHRYDNGKFFPSSTYAAASVIGKGPGTGFNVNIPWNQKGMGNAEYAAAFLQVVLPIAYQFAPELVLVSAGFDAAVSDPLGGCQVYPEMYGLMTSWLAPLAMGRLILCLEGGYNLTSIAYAMTLCTKALLGDPVPPVQMRLPLKPSAVADLRTVLDIQAKYWPALRFNKSLPAEDFSFEQIKNVAETTKDDKIDDLIKSMSDKLTMNVAEPHCAGGKETDQKSKGGSAEASQAGPSQPQPGASGETTKITITSTMDAILKELGMDEGFAVHPRHDCPHLPAVAPLPSTGIDVATPCLDCGMDSCATVENWICLTCYSVHCGRVIKEHMMLHSVTESHPIVLGFVDLSVWCYFCDSYIESPTLYEAKNAAYQSKFGETMPNIYSK